MAVAQVGSAMNSNYHRIFEDRLRRIVEECYEVAFILCNSELDEFGASKVFDVFTQTFSTAYVLNTGYWPFFSSIKGQCLCICGRFGVPCRHVRSEYHWIDMQTTENDPGSLLFYPKAYGNVHPQEYEIIIKPVAGDVCSFTIDVIFTVQYRKPDRMRPPRRDKVLTASSLKQIKETYKQTFHLGIYSRFCLYPEYYPAMYTIVFQPNPFFHDQYGTYFKNLVLLRSFEYTHCLNDHDSIWYITCAQMPSSTFILQEVNVPVYKTSHQQLVFYPQSNFFKQRAQKKKRNKSNQTPWSVNIADQEVSNIWNYYPEQSQAISRSLRDIASASTSSQASLNDRSDDLVIIDDSVEYDNQLPSVCYNKIVKPTSYITEKIKVEVELLEEVTKAEPSPSDEDLLAQGVKRKYPHWSAKGQLRITPNIVEEFTKSCNEPDSTTNLSPGLTGAQNEFNFVVPDAPKMSDSDHSYSKPSERNVEWFEKNFPPLKATVKMRKTEIDEEFELIETVIREDVMKKDEEEVDTEDGDKEWWHAPTK